MKLIASTCSSRGALKGKYRFPAFSRDAAQIASDGFHQVGASLCFHFAIRTLFLV